MVIIKHTRSTDESKTLAQLNVDDIDVTGHFGRVRIDMKSTTNRGTRHLYRLSLSKEEAIELVKELYTYLEPDL